MDVDVNNVLIGTVVMPPLIALLNQKAWPPPVKGLIALVACLCAALLTEVLSGPLTFANWRVTALTVAASAFAAYQVWWKPSGLAPAIEDATTL